MKAAPLPRAAFVLDWSWSEVRFLLLPGGGRRWAMLLGLPGVREYCFPPLPSGLLNGSQRLEGGTHRHPIIKVKAAPLPGAAFVLYWGWSGGCSFLPAGRQTVGRTPWPAGLLEVSQWLEGSTHRHPIIKAKAAPLPGAAFVLYWGSGSCSAGQISRQLPGRAGHSPVLPAPDQRRPHRPPGRCPH